MIIGNATRPIRCKLCLRNADAEIQRHLREGRPCHQQGCPLSKIINTALEYQRNRPGIIFGTRTRPSTKWNQETTIRFPSMIHVINNKTMIDHVSDKMKKLIKSIINKSTTLFQTLKIRLKNAYKSIIIWIDDSLLL